jgi:two-component system KDP operon response regulator KdpE
MTDFSTAFKKLRGGKQAEDAQPIASAPKRTVLVMDDDPDMLRAMRLALYEAGFEVITSSSGIKGINTLRFSPRCCDAILLDYNMPGLNGGQALPYVREFAPHAKIVCISGYDAKDLPPELRDGADKVIHKPFTITTVISALNVLLRGTPSAGTAPK